MELVKQNRKVIVVTLIPQGGKPKDAVELVFKDFVDPALTTALLAEGYAVGLALEQRDVMVEDYTATPARPTSTRKPAPSRKPVPKSSDVKAASSTVKKNVVEEIPEPNPEPEEIEIVTTVAPKKKPAAKTPAKAPAKRQVEPDEDDEIIIE